MKIKVVDMPYEQALAQPREKHTPPRRPSMLFRALLRALVTDRVQQGQVFTPAFWT